MKNLNKDRMTLESSVCPWKVFGRCAIRLSKSQQLKTGQGTRDGEKGNGESQVFLHHWELPGSRTMQNQLPCLSPLPRREGCFTRNLSSCLSGSAEVRLQDIHSSERLSSVVSLVKCYEKGIFKSVRVLMVSHIVFLRVGCVSERILRYICAGPKPAHAP